MATQRQHDFVDHVEEAIKALSVQNKNPPTITAIMEHSGHGPTELFSIVTRLKEGGEHILLSRLRSVFDKAKKLPLCLEDVEPVKKVHSSLPRISEAPMLRLENAPVPETIPVISAELTETFERIHAGFEEQISRNHKYFEKARIQLPMAPDDEDVVDDTLGHVLRLLRPLSRSQRGLVIATAMRRYEVGE